MKATLRIEDDSGQTYEGEVVLRRQAVATKVKPKKEKTSTTPAPRTPTQALEHLHTADVFKSERTLAAVEAELAKIDCNFPKASLAKALERADFLTRRGTRGNYRWIQRYKPGA